MVVARFDDSFRDQPLQPIRQDVAGNTFRRREKFGKAPLAAHHVPHHQQRPFVPDEVERAGDRAARSHGVTASVASNLQNASHST
jgi:hypothetical protein